MIRKLVFFTVVFTSSMISQFAIAEDSKSGSQQDVIVEDKVDAREHIAGLDWTDTKPWSDIRSSWFSNDLLWPFYEEVKAQPFSLDNADFKALIKGISYLSWKSPQVHFTGEFIASLKNDKSLTDEQIEGIFKSISYAPAQKKLRADYKVVASVSEAGQDSGNDLPEVEVPEKAAEASEHK